MPRSIVTKGSTVDEAIQTGLLLLKSSIDDIDIDVIQMERKSFFGLNKKAVVKLTVVSDQREPAKRAPLLEEDLSDLLDDVLEEKKPVVTQERRQQTDKDAHLTGKAWIIDGQVFVKESPTQFPVLVPCEGVSLYKNGERVEDSVIVSAEDEVRIEPDTEEVQPTWSINVDASSMEASLHVKPGHVTTYDIEDCEPSSFIKLYAKKRQQEILGIPVHEVINRLGERGIVFGVDYEEIRKAAETDSEGTFVIAAGQRPKDGSNGQLKYLIDMEYKTHQPTEREDGTLDFRESFHVPSVSPGQVITEYVPPVEGEPGKNIYGVDIPAPPVHDLIFHAKNGIMLMEPEKKLIAKAHGRPHIEKRGTLVKAAILPKLTVHEDVDIEKGNIRFSGDVELLKNVHEKMIVEADGDIILHGNADFATLTAGSSILIKKNAINCDITAGKGNILISDLYQLLGDLEGQMFKLIQAVKQLYTANAFKTSDLAMMGLGALIKILLERKFKELPPLLKEFVKKVGEGGNLLDEEWHSLANRLNKGFLVLSKDEFHSVEELMHVLKEVGRFYQISSLPPEPDSNIAIGYALNSQIYCSGDVQIFQTGCYNSKINSGGKISVKGYVRGGYLYAKLGAVIEETGSEGGSRAVIHVPAGQSIKIGKVNEGTMVKVGNKSHLFTKDAYNVHARFDENEQLHLF
jgi:uncharacterized protein